MRKEILFVALASLLTACQSQAQKSNQEIKTETPKKEMKMTNKEKAHAFVAAATSQDAETVRELADANYIQHNPYLPTGLEPFIGLFPVLEENGTQAEVHRSFVDGNYVIMHHLWTGAKPFGADEMVSFDILRIDENGKVAEHWDAMQSNVTETASGRKMYDGPTEITDLEQTDNNKALVRSLLEDVLMGKDPSKITEYISAETYNQHNPQIKDGLAGINEAIQYLVSIDDMFQYQKIHRIFGEGNFILSISEGLWHGKTHVFYDLFRCENGQLVEHWDVIQEVPTENLANENGMFGF